MSELQSIITTKSKPYIIAHRGNSELCPENTLAAFNQAIEDGADILETDLHLTRDGYFVCIHDTTVDRTTNGQGKVGEMKLSEIKTLNAAYGRTNFENERVPTLEEVSEILPEDRLLVLELKTDYFLKSRVVEQLIDKLQVYGVLNRTMILSFSKSRLKSVKQVAPDLPLGLVSMSNIWPHPEMQLLGPFWPLLLLNPWYVKKAHQRGQFVCPLDPNPNSRLALYRRLGCDALLTNNSADTKKALFKMGFKEW